MTTTLTSFQRRKIVLVAVLLLLTAGVVWWCLPVSGEKLLADVPEGSRVYVYAVVPSEGLSGTPAAVELTLSDRGELQRKGNDFYAYALRGGAFEAFQFVS